MSFFDLIVINKRIHFRRGETYQIQKKIHNAMAKATIRLQTKKENEKLLITISSILYGTHEFIHHGETSCDGCNSNMIR